MWPGHCTKWTSNGLNFDGNDFAQCVIVFQYRYPSAGLANDALQSKCDAFICCLRISWPNSTSDHVEYGRAAKLPLEICSFEHNSDTSSLNCICFDGILLVFFSHLSDLHCASDGEVEEESWVLTSSEFQVGSSNSLLRITNAFGEHF